MDFYVIEFHSFPKLLFSCTVSTEGYENIITHRQNMLEIACCDAAIAINEEGVSTEIPPYNFVCTLPDRDIHLKAVDENIGNLTSVAIRGDFTFRRVSSDTWNKTDLKENELILPLQFKLQKSDFTRLEAMLRQVNLLFPQKRADQQMMAIGVWCKILGEVHALLYAQLFGKLQERVALYYTEKAKSYIQQHYAEKVLVQDIAAVLGITPNYLSSTFRRETGMRLSEYLVSVRLEKARDLLRDGRMTYEEVAEAVGIGTETYLNRLFVRWYGVNIRKCVLSDRELTLYHPKPWGSEKLERDVWGENE